MVWLVTGHFGDDTRHCCLRIADPAVLVGQVDHIAASSTSIMPIHDMVAPVLSAVSRAIELILDESAEILDGIIGVPAFSEESFVPFAESALGDWVVAFNSRTRWK